MGLVRILNRRTMRPRAKKPAANRVVWHKVFAQSKTVPGARFVLLAQFKMRIDADIWRDQVAQRNNSWKVEVR